MLQGFFLPFYKKLLGSIVLVILVLQAFPGHAFTWNTQIAIAGNGPGMSIALSPAMAVDSKGFLHGVSGCIQLRDNCDLFYATNASGVWESILLDKDASGHAVSSSIAIDGNDKVHVVYSVRYTRHLKYATNASGVWTVTKIAEYKTTKAGYVGEVEPSMVIDIKGKLHVAYIDVSNGKLSYATNASGKWEVKTIDTGTNIPRIPVIAVDQIQRVRIAYYNSTKKILDLATYNGKSWSVETIDATADQINDIDMTTDIKDAVHVSYYYGWDKGDLRYVSNASGKWKSSTLDSEGHTGIGTSIATDLAGKVYISYLDLTNSDLKLVSNASGNWVREIVDSYIYVYQPTCVDSFQKKNVAMTSLLRDDKGDWHVFYGSHDNRNIKYSTTKKTFRSDLTDHYGAYTGTYAAISVASNGTRHLIYRDDWSKNAIYSNDTGLYYPQNSAFSADMMDLTHSWNRQGILSQATFLALDNDSYSNAHVFSYVSGVLKYSTNFSGKWKSTTVDSSADVGKYVSARVDGLNWNHAVYYDETNKRLKYATNVNGGKWETTVIDGKDAKNSGSDTFSMVGKYAALALDFKNNVHVSYYDETNGDLKYAVKRDGKWKITLIESKGDVGQYSAITTDDWGYVYIAYYDASFGDLKLATNFYGSWTTEFVDSLHDSGKFVSIDTDGYGAVHMSYYDATDTDLMYAYGMPGEWLIQRIDGGKGLDAGKYSSLEVGPDGRVNVAYYDGTNQEIKIVDFDAGHALEIEIPDKNKKQKVVICHNPPGNVGNAHTIKISENAVDAHLAHGDYLGECKSVIANKGNDKNIANNKQDLSNNSSSNSKDSKTATMNSEKKEDAKIVESKSSDKQPALSTVQKSSTGAGTLPQVSGKTEGKKTDVKSSSSTVSSAPSAASAKQTTVVKSSGKKS